MRASARRILRGAGRGALLLLMLARAPERGAAAPLPYDPCPRAYAEPGSIESVRDRLAIVRGSGGEERAGTLPRIGFRSGWCGERAQAANARAGRAGAHGPILRGDLLVGGESRRGESLFARGAPPDVEATRVPDRTRPLARTRVDLSWGELRGGIRVSTSGLGRALPDNAIEALFVAHPIGPMHGWVGRRAPAWGIGGGGGLVVDGRVPMNGVGVGSRAPLRLPGWGERLGSWDFDVVVSRLNDNAPIGSPWFFGGRWSWSPAPAVTFGVERGAMFGGEGAPGITLGRLLSVLIGDHRYEDGSFVHFENQIAAFGLALRPRVGGVPILVGFDLGMEDSAGAWHRSPAMQALIEIVHPTRALGIGLEHTYMSRERGHGIWYRHTLYEHGWSDRGRGLGHPLAGPGTEWLVHVTAGSDPGASGPGRWTARVGLRIRDRLPSNALSPRLEGRSFGGFAKLAYAVREHAELHVDIDAERARSGAGSGFVEIGARFVSGR